MHDYSDGFALVGVRVATDAIPIPDQTTMVGITRMGVADPGDHMGRVAAQGDMRPMAASAEAMEDLKRILAGRSAFYAKADLRFNTSDYDSEEAAFRALRQSVQEATGIKA